MAQSWADGFREVLEAIENRLTPHHARSHLGGEGFPRPKRTPMTDTIEVTTTTATREEAQRIAVALVEHRLAACAQVQGPLTSTYWWQGKIETADEWRCVAKTRVQLFNQVEVAIRQLHSYQTPEILAVRVEAGSAAYLQWMQDALTTPNGG